MPLVSVRALQGYLIALRVKCRLVNTAQEALRDGAADSWWHQALCICLQGLVTEMTLFAFF